MYRIERKFSFPAGHRLTKHQGRCKQIHGHNYVIYVGLKTLVLNKNDMVMDFSDLKYMVENYFDKFDHSIIINEKDVSLKNIKDCKYEIISYDGRDPTAEVMAEEFYKYIEKMLDINYTGIDVDYIKVFETENSNATYSLD